MKTVKPKFDLKLTHSLLFWFILFEKDEWTYLDFFSRKDYYFNWEWFSAHNYHNASLLSVWPNWYPIITFMWIVDCLIVYRYGGGWWFSYSTLSNSSTVWNKRTGWKIPLILINVRYWINIQGGKIPKF